MMMEVTAIMIVRLITVTAATITIAPIPHIMAIMLTVITATTVAIASAVSMTMIGYTAERTANIIAGDPMAQQDL